MRRFSLWFAALAALCAFAAGAAAHTQEQGATQDEFIIQGEQGDAEHAGFGRFPPIAQVFRVPRLGHQERRIAVFLGLNDRQAADMHDLLEQYHSATRPIVEKRNEAFRALLRTLAPNYDQEHPTFWEVATRINGLEGEILNNELRFWAEVKGLLTDQQERRFFLLFEARILGPV